MKISKLLPVLALLLFLAGCATTHKTNELRLGMSRDEVLVMMGTPSSTHASKGVEYLEYLLWKDLGERSPGDWKDRYFVRIVDGKVDAYGRLGDFDSTQIPEDKTTIDLNIKSK